MQVEWMMDPTATSSQWSGVAGEMGRGRGRPWPVRRGALPMIPGGVCLVTDHRERHVKQFTAWYLYADRRPFSLDGAIQSKKRKTRRKSSQQTNPGVDIIRTSPSRAEQAGKEQNSVADTHIIVPGLEELAQGPEEAGEKLLLGLPDGGGPVRRSF